MSSIPLPPRGERGEHDGDEFEQRRRRPAEKKKKKEPTEEDRFAERATRKNDRRESGRSWRDYTTDLEEDGSAAEEEDE